MKLLTAIASITVIAVLAHVLVLPGLANKEDIAMQHHGFHGKKKTSSQGDFSGRRVALEYGFELGAAPTEVFPLLCPVREYDWIEHWDCRMVYSDSGVAENNCIFVTNLLSDHEAWVVSRYEPDKCIEFVVTSAAGVVMKLDIALEDGGGGKTKIHWRRTFTGLSDDGNDFVAALTEEKFLEQMRGIEAMLKHYLATGEMLKGHDIVRDKPKGH